MRRLPIIIAALLFPTAAFAHPDISHAAGLLHGFEHPLGGIDHILAMIAVHF
ncbi:MAG TPA: HupE/UreJ family protein, partial [Devosia sp.]|nr:HupE/UreJ family protein [Devosia sp.]